MAAQHGLLEILTAAVDRGADADATYRRTQSIALHMAAIHDQPGAIDRLIEASANIKARDDLDCTPLNDAAKQCRLNAVLSRRQDEGIPRCEDLTFGYELGVLLTGPPRVCGHTLC